MAIGTWQKGHSDQRSRSATELDNAGSLPMNGRGGWHKTNLTNMTQLRHKPRDKNNEHDFADHVIICH